MRTILSTFLFVVSLTAYSQTNTINGEILDETGNPLPSSTVVLLDPADSTMQYFSITGSSGAFEIKGIRKGDYLLQSAYIGYNSFYQDISIPAQNNGKLGKISLTPSPVSMDAVQITGERIPLKFDQDTIEYDAKAFKTSPDANVEELLKKLPGVEVDRAGNIKALGEDVTTVLVDGKEFFSNDPKVATKNLPANALDKVQLYNKKTEEAEFTGIDDGTRNQTINLVLNEENKDGVFGEVVGGGGTDSHYDASGKVYKFTEKSQIAALGMLNNVNKFGFSIGDYISFSGGIANISHGKGGPMSDGNSFPINFGETISGYSSSGAAGLNYSYSLSKYQRFFISYLGSGTKRELNESTKTTSYRENDEFFQDEYSEQVQHDTAHNLNFGIRYLFRETNNIIINGGASFNTAYIPLSSNLSSSQNNIPINDLYRNSADLSDRLSGNVSGTYLKKIYEGSTILKFNSIGSYSSSNSETDFENQTNFYSPDIVEIINQFQDNSNIAYNYSGSLSLTQKLFGAFYLDLAMRGGNSNEVLNRTQGDIATVDVPIDALSPDFEKSNTWLRPGITLKRNMEKSTLSLAVDYNMGQYSTTLNTETPLDKEYKYFQPRLSWQYRYKTGRRMMLRYSSAANLPSANQLLPVVNNFNSLSLFYGNENLNPEFKHSLSANWWVFDQFSFTTLLTSVRVNYTKDKINYSRTVFDNLAQEIRLVNVDSDFSANGNIDFSTPIRALGIKTNINFQESYNRGINIVNTVENEIINIGHKASLSFDNRKKEKWDINTGVGISLTDARYSIQESLNNIYFDLSWFGEIAYLPNDKINFFLTADVTNYTAQSFEESQLVPLLGAEVSYFFLKNNRASLTLAAHDLLNKNTGIRRVSEMNYLQEKTSNIIGRYFMLSLKYRLNKFGGDTGMNMKIRKR